MAQAIAETDFLSAAVSKHTDQSETTVLLVEDEEMVRKLLCEALKREGYRVLACGDAHEGLEAGRSGLQIDLLLTDVMMPGMSGMEMAQRIQRNQPQLRVVFMSGCPEGQPEGIDNEHGFLHKPFTLKALTNTLARAMQEVQVSKG